MRKVLLKGIRLSIRTAIHSDRITASGTAAAEGKIPGTYPMNLKAEQFTNTNENFEASFEVTDGVLTVTKGTIVLTANSFTAVSSEE